MEQREDGFLALCPHLLESASELDFDYATPWQAVTVRLPVKVHFLAGMSERPVRKPNILPLNPNLELSDSEAEDE